MSNRFIVITAAALLLICILAVPLQSPAQVCVGYGQPAPALHISKWLLGTPVTHFEPGRYYLIEFTHRKCRACLEAIPHLSHWARRYRDKLTVLSIYSYWKSDTWSEEEYIQSILDLKEHLGEQMDFTVAIDRRNAETNKEWRGEAAFFPFAFLVDQQGNIVWWGMVDHAEIDRMLESVFAGMFDGKRQIAETAAYNQYYSKVWDSLLHLPADSVLAIIDSMDRRFPEKIWGLSYLRFQVYLRHDISRAGRYLDTVMRRYPAFSFDPEEIFNVQQPEGLDWKMGLRLYNREFRKSSGLSAQAAVLLKKSKLYAFNGCYREAEATARYAMLLRREQFGIHDSQAGMYADWLQVYAIKRLLGANTGKGLKSLEQHLVNKTIRKGAAVILLNLFYEDIPRDLILRIGKTAGSNTGGS